MNKSEITFSANEQSLIKTGGIDNYASNTVSYIEASFTLGDNWAGYDSIRAVWESGYARIATVLDANNKCIVPAEVLTYKSKVNVNLVGSIVENTVLTDRLTTYPILALTVDADARVDSSETTPVTASQFEQFVDVVRDEASAIQNYTYDSEAWAVGQRAGVDVPSTDETYQNNAKYYADQGATLQQEVTDLKSDFNSSFGYGKNRVNPNQFENGYLNTSGVVTSSAYDWKTTGFIDIHDLPEVKSSAYSISDDERVNCPLYFLCTYDINRDFIAQKYTDTTVNAYTVENGVYYIRYSVHSNIYNQFQLESGGTATSYVPFTYVLKDISLPNDVKAVTDNFNPIIETIDSTLTNTQLIDITSDFTLLEGYIDNSNGNLVVYAQAESTGYINLYEYRDLYITGRPAYSSNCLYAVYDESKNYLGYHRKDGLVETDYHITLWDILDDYPTALYVRCSTITTYQNLVIKRPANLQEVIQSIGVSKWVGKKWVCIGDSLTEVNSRTTKHYYDYVSDATGITIVNLGSSGRGYKNPSSVDSKTYDDVVSDVPLDADVVTIFGSGNDLVHGYTLGNVTDTGTTTICGCINTTFDSLIDRIPTIQLGIVAPTPWVSWPPSTADNAMEQYVEALQTICKNRSIPFLDLYHCSNLRPWTAEGRTACYSKDEGNGVHPDENGHKLIAPRFEGFLDFLLV